MPSTSKGGTNGQGAQGRETGGAPAKGRKAMIAKETSTGSGEAKAPGGRAAKAKAAAAGKPMARVKTQPEKADKMADKKARKLAEKEARKLAEKEAETEKEAKRAAEKKGRERAELAKKAKKLAKEQARKREKDHKKIKYESRMRREEAVVYFDALVAGLRKGAVQFKQGNETVVVSPSGLVDVEIKATTKGRKEKVTFELSWLSEDSRDISITSS